jgi:hypothetical protein
LDWALSVAVDKRIMLAMVRSAMATNDDEASMLTASVVLFVAVEKGQQYVHQD